MQRNLHYLLYCPTASFELHRPVIEQIQRAMNEGFTWGEDRLDLALFDECYLFDDYADPLVPELRHRTPAAVGRTVCDDWNALLVCRFMRWVSTTIRDSVVRVVDDGIYIAVGGLLGRAGEWQTDGRNLGAWERYLIESGRWVDGYHALQAARSCAKARKLFAPVRASTYADRPEIAALGLAPQELPRLSLEEVADRVRFPWQPKVH